MIDSLRVAQTVPDPPSPWWLKGGAIFIGVLGLSSLVGAASLALSGILIETMMDDIDSEERCAEDPDIEGCEALFASLKSMSDMRLWDVGAAFSAFLFLLSIPTAFLMWNAEDRRTALTLAWVWVGIHATSQLYIIHSYMKWQDEFYESIPTESIEWVGLFSKVASYGSTLMCELTLAAGLALISYKTRPPTALEVPSAFHLEEE